MHDIKIPGAPIKKTDIEVTRVTPPEMKHLEPSDKIKVKFDKFVQLVATHDFGDVMKRYANEDIIMSSNLLTDLASSHEETEPKTNKVPMIFIVGLVIGIVVTYLLVRN